MVQRLQPPNRDDLADLIGGGKKLSQEQERLLRSFERLFRLSGRLFPNEFDTTNGNVQTNGNSIFANGLAIGQAQIDIAALDNDLTTVENDLDALELAVQELSFDDLDDVTTAAATATGQYLLSYDTASSMWTVAPFTAPATSSTSGTFTSADGKTITVNNGLIASIV